MRRINVPCVLDIEQTAEAFYAHATPMGVDVGPGDAVYVHGAPSRVAFGDRFSLTCSATITRASLLTRLWTHMTAPLELFELFEVGFQPKE
jgi:hypothetical protein